jgi:hypothetical protein
MWRDRGDFGRRGQFAKGEAVPDQWVELLMCARMKLA